ncbi:hypothetical protein FRB91_010359 [Serendipita sp. 411]|nr:hypothetical protein FRB91_010359 [Serendipita sp. 411]
MAFKAAFRTALILALSLPVLANPLLTRRKITTNPDDVHGIAFDYVIVGGGAAGLVLANRLSEDDNRTVLVIEAGDDGEAVMERILVPALTYLNGVAVPNSPNDWGYWASSLGGRWFHQPRAKILGGSTAVNALYMVRASKEEHDAWASLLPNADQDWSWDGLYPYMLKTENFSPPVDASLTGTIVNESYHGHDGPVHVSYPQYTYQSAAAWTPTLANLGLKTTDPQGGQGWGGFITPNSIDPRDGTRSYSKTAYLDPVVNRRNLVILLQSQATKITFDTSGTVPRATGVDFAQRTNGTIYHVDAASEVIVAGGVFGTPQLLQLSGIGPKPLLDSWGIPTVVDLPGVGEHFQDHVLVSMTWTATNTTVTGDLLWQNTTFAADQLKLFHDGKLSQSLITQYHPASTSSMLPLEKGGVVDPSLRVYNTLGLRVIDSSVIPIGMCAHLMGPTYAIAEKGAVMIKANPVPNRIPHSNLESGSERTTVSNTLVLFLTSLLALTVSGML